MATLIPALGSVTSRMTSGERRFAERLEAKLEDDYLCWYDVAIGEKTRHPDFIVFHPSRGLLVLEVKDWQRRKYWPSRAALRMSCCGRLRQPKTRRLPCNLSVPGAAATSRC